MEEKIQKIVSAALITDGQKILILKRSADEDVLPGIWELPSGKVEFGENAEEALLREAKEETGLDVDIVGPSNTFSYLIEKPDKIKHTIQINFIAKAKMSEVKLSTEHDEYAWIKKEEIEDYDITPETKEALRKGFDYLKSCKI